VKTPAEPTLTVFGIDRQAELIGRGKRLQYFTVAWNSLEGIAAIAAGVLAGSISLISFGLDSFIEVTSGAAALWRVSSESNTERKERVEQISLRVVGVCFLALAAYIAVDSTVVLIRREAPNKSIFGMVVAIASLIVMPLLARAKRRIGAGLRSAAVTADARQTDFCVYLSAILLAGLLLNAIFGWWWSDPVAALVMVPLIAKEGIEAVRGETSCSTCVD
jgi:divalent metal cation (Fe/Co/Zn/Cd) transporter